MCVLRAILCFAQVLPAAAHTAEPRDMALHHASGLPGGEAQMVRVWGGKSLQLAVHDRHHLLRSCVHDAHEVWDVTLPGPPQRVAVVADNLRGTHKTWWECDTGIA